MDIIECIQENFYRSIEIKKNAAESLPNVIAAACAILIECIKNGNKILSCGNGGSACDAQHFAAELVNRFIIERDNLPAIALNADTAVLTAIANDYCYEEIFTRQIKALGRSGDVLLAISTSGNSKNIISAIKAAQQRNLRVIALTGNDGGMVRSLLSENDIEVCAPSKSTPHIQEVHTLIIHCLCDLIDRQLFSKNEVMA